MKAAVDPLECSNDHMKRLLELIRFSSTLDKKVGNSTALQYSGDLKLLLDRLPGSSLCYCRHLDIHLSCQSSARAREAD